MVAFENQEPEIHPTVHSFVFRSKSANYGSATYSSYLYHATVLSLCLGVREFCTILNLFIVNSSDVL